MIIVRKRLVFNGPDLKETYAELPSQNRAPQPRPRPQISPVLFNFDNSPIDPTVDLIAIPA
jgi:hypothetical protein